MNSSDSEERDVFLVKSEDLNKEQVVVKDFLKSKSNKLNMNIENDGFFKTKTNVVNYFEEMYRVPHFKNKLFYNNNYESEYMFEKTKGSNNEINLNNIEFNRDYHNYLIKLEKLKLHNNLDIVSTFFLNSWKRKFQENKDKEEKKLNTEEVNNKEIEDQNEIIEKNRLFNEHTFLEYLQYKYDRHCQNINFADVHARTRIILDFKNGENIKECASSRLNTRSSKNNHILSLEDVIINHVKHDHFTCFKNPNTSCDELKKIVEKIKLKKLINNMNSN